MHLIIPAKARVLRAAHIILAHILSSGLADAGFLAGAVAVAVIWGVEAAAKADVRRAGLLSAGRTGWRRLARRFLGLVLRLARRSAGPSAGGGPRRRPRTHEGEDFGDLQMVDSREAGHDNLIHSDKSLGLTLGIYPSGRP